MYCRVVQDGLVSSVGLASWSGIAGVVSFSRPSKGVNSSMSPLISSSVSPTVNERKIRHKEGLRIAMEATKTCF
jgi:hypothetical protein